MGTDQIPEQRSDSQLQPQHDSRPHGQPEQPWFKRPSVAWILSLKALAALSFSIASGSRLQILTELVCSEYYRERFELNGFVNFPSGHVTSTGIFHSGSLSLAQATRTVGSCVGDPVVQAEVARVNATFAIISGILAFFTAGWWGGFMDRYGRTRIMGMTVLGPLLGDILTLLIVFFPHYIPWGYWFLVIGPIVEGILGSPSSTSAAETSYMRDVSQPHNLARNFSLLIGIYHTGITIGPTLGGLLNERTGIVITALFVTTILHIAYAFITWFVMPESVSGASMIHAREQYASELASAANASDGPFRRQLLVFFRAFWDSFPLRVLMPRHSTNSRWKKDWSLTLLALSAGLVNIIMASMGDVFQYGLYTFRWSSLQLGYFMSASGLSAAVFLTAILPAVVGALKRVPAKPQRTEDAKQDSVFDLHLLRASSLVFAAGYALMAFAPTGFTFTLCYMVTTLGLGFIPAVQSVATILYASVPGQDSVGRLFSALGVVYGIGGRLLGPLIFGTVFSSTVSFFPTAIFWTAVGCASTAFLLLAFVRLPSLPSTQDVEQADSGVVPRRNRDGPNSELDPLLGPRE